MQRKACGINRKSLENHRKSIGKFMAIIMAVFGQFMVEMYSNYIFNGLTIFSASFWYNKIPISLF